MQRLREHESHELLQDGDNAEGQQQQQPQQPQTQQEGRLSVLSPDNRQYLERPRSKSPDMRNKRMIIGMDGFFYGFGIFQCMMYVAWLWFFF